jgi:hypothetical protein
MDSSAGRLSNWLNIPSGLLLLIGEASGSMMSSPASAAASIAASSAA